MRFCFNLLDIDSDGVLTAGDLKIITELVNPDCSLGKEIQILLVHYERTHLRVKTFVKAADAIDFEKYILLLQKARGTPVPESCLVEELLKKTLSQPEKFKKTSVFICTNEQLVEALKQRQTYKGIADAIISGRSYNEALVDVGDAKEEDLALALGRLNNPLENQDKKKSVQFNLPKQKK